MLLKNNKKMRYHFALVGLVFLIASCAVSNAPTEIKTKRIENNESNIVFVVFKIKKGQQKSTIEIVSQNISHGKIKKQLQETVDPNKSLTIEVNTSDEVAQINKMNHPLYKNVEYLNETGKLERKEVELEEDTFFIRFQSKGGSTTLKIKEKLKDSPENEIATFKL